MLQKLYDFWYTLKGGWWLFHEDKWVKIRLVEVVDSVLWGNVFVFKKDFEWNFPAIINCGFSPYKGHLYIECNGVIYCTLSRRINK
jgi:hypothetical protein